MCQSLGIVSRCESICRVEPEEGIVEMSKICCLDELERLHIHTCKMAQTAVKISQTIVVQDIEIRRKRRKSQKV